MVVWRPARGGRRGQIAARVGSNGMARRGVAAFLLGGGTKVLLQAAQSNWSHLQQLYVVSALISITSFLALVAGENPTQGHRTSATYR